jgi:hypothetical protein
MKHKTKTKRRNIAAERHTHQLPKTEFFRGLPRHVLRGYSVLFVLGGEVGVKLKEEGLVRSDGTWNPGIDILRRLKDSERQYLQLMLEMGRGRTPEGEPSLAAEFAQADEEPASALGVGDEEKE